MRKSRLLLVIILVFAFIIRFIFLTRYPEGFYQNEASWGYNAYSLMHTGRDEYGRFLPVVLESFGDYKMAFNAYYLIPFIKILGLTEFAVRMGTVVASWVTLLLSYLIFGKFVKNRKTALLALFVLSILPWQIVFSRIGNETATAMMLYLFSLLLFLRSYEKKSILFFLAGILALILSILTYYSVWILSIFTIGIYLLLEIKKRQNISSIFLKIILFIIPLLVIIIAYKSTGSERLKQINIFQNSGAKSLLDEQIREDQKEFPYLMTRIFHNKLTFYPYFILRNYFNTFSFNFLFLEGDKSEQIYNVPYSGVIYSVFSFFTLVGSFIFIKKYGKNVSLIVFSFILINFLGNAVSVFGSQSQRTLIASVGLSLLIAEGIIQFHRYIKQNKYIKGCFFLFFIIMLFQISNFSHQYFWHANRNKPWYRNYGAKEMILTLRKLAPEYEKIIVTGNTSFYIYHYFYNKIDPVIAQKESKEMSDFKDALSHSYRKRVADYLIMPLDCPFAGKIGALYVCKGNVIPQNSRIVKAIYFQDNQPAFVFIEFTLDKQNERLTDPFKYSKSSGIISGDSEKYWMNEEELSKTERL